MTRKLGYLEAKHEESKAWSRLYTIIHTYIYIFTCQVSTIFAGFTGWGEVTV